MTKTTGEVAVFEQSREFLAGLAYRMLGSLAEAEDVVQDAFLRWRDVDHGAVVEPRAYLARVVSRLCLDRMKSASRRRETYVGTWLPEPVVAEPAQRLADDLSVALLLALERLSPLMVRRSSTVAGRRTPSGMLRSCPARAHRANEPQPGRHGSGHRGFDCHRWVRCVSKPPSLGARPDRLSARRGIWSQEARAVCIAIRSQTWLAAKLGVRVNSCSSSRRPGGGQKLLLLLPLTRRPPPLTRRLPPYASVGVCGLPG